MLWIIEINDKDFAVFKYEVWPWIDSSLATYIPATLLVVLNALIVYKIVASRRAMLTSHARNPASSSANAARSKLAATTVVLFVESALFLLLNVPFEVLYSPTHSTRIFDLLSWQSRCYMRVLIFDFSEFVSFLGSALNFALYMLTGRKFRKAFMKTVCRRTDVVLDTLFRLTA